MMKRIVVISAFILVSAFMRAQTLLSIEDCRAMALQNNHKVRNSSLDMLAAGARKQEALAEYFPKVFVSSYGFMAMDPMVEIGVSDIFGNNGFSDNLQAAVDYLGTQYGFPSVFSTLKSGFSVSVTAMQPLYAGGRIVTGNSLAALGSTASQIQDELTVREVIEDVDKDYWTVVSLSEKMAALEESEAFMESLLKDVAAAVAAGLALDTDLMQVELKRNELKRMRLSLTGGIKLAKMNLCNTIGQSYADDIVLTESLEDLNSPQEYYVPEEEMVAGLSEIQLLEMSVQQKKLERRMALGEALPQIAVGASYGYSRLVNDRFNGIVFGMVRIPLSDWGKVSRKVKSIDYAMQKAQNDRNYLGDQLLLQVRKLWIDLNVAWEDVIIASGGVELAQKNVEMMCDKYASGLVPVSDLLQARTQLSIQQNTCIDARIAYSSALLSYLLRQNKETD